MDEEQAIETRPGSASRDGAKAAEGSASALAAKVLPREWIAPEDVAAMYRLYATHYLDTDTSTFERDLAGKTHVLVLADEGGALCGFSTLELYATSDVAGMPIRVVFSGDTIIAPAHWGNSALAFEWLRFVGQEKRRRRHLPLYWLLIVKGHRTYRYLSTFARRYTPHHEPGSDAGEEALRDALASAKFGTAYDPASGVARFGPNGGRLSEPLADVSETHRSRPAVAYFLERNPGYRRGDELVCVCELADSNLRPLARRVFSAETPG